MNKLSFEELPQTVAQIFLRVINIERILQAKNEDSKSESDEVLTVKQAAEFLSLSVATVYGYVQRSEIPYTKGPKRLYFSKSKLIEWINSNQRKTISEIKASAEELLKRKK